MDPRRAEEWLSRNERERLTNFAAFMRYLGTTMGPDRPRSELALTAPTEPIEVVDHHDPEFPRD